MYINVLIYTWYYLFNKFWEKVKVRYRVIFFNILVQQKSTELELW